MSILETSAKHRRRDPVIEVYMKAYLTGSSLRPCRCLCLETRWLTGQTPVRVLVMNSKTKTFSRDVSTVSVVSNCLSTEQREKNQYLSHQGDTARVASLLPSSGHMTLQQHIRQPLTDQRPIKSKVFHAPIFDKNNKKREIYINIIY